MGLSRLLKRSEASFWTNFERPDCVWFFFTLWVLSCFAIYTEQCCISEILCTCAYIYSIIINHPRKMTYRRSLGLSLLFPTSLFVLGCLHTYIHTWLHFTWNSQSSKKATQYLREKEHCKYNTTSLLFTITSIYITCLVLSLFYCINISPLKVSVVVSNCA